MDPGENASKELAYAKVKGIDNCADLMTNALSNETTANYIELLSFEVLIYLELEIFNASCMTQ